MVEREFEAGLERLFNQPPAFDDNDAFARRVTTRLDSSWRMRAMAITVAGVVGGVIAVSQTVGSGLGLRVREAEADTTRTIDSLYQQAVSQAPLFDIAGLDVGANLFWMASALLILVAGAASTRLFDEA